MRALILVIMMRKTYCWAGTRRLCNLFSSVSFPGFFCLVLLTGEAELPGGYKELKCSTAGPTVYVVLWDTLKSAVVSHKRSTLWPMPKNCAPKKVIDILRLQVTMLDIISRGKLPADVKYALRVSNLDSVQKSESGAVCLKAGHPLLFSLSPNRSTRESWCSDLHLWTIPQTVRECIHRLRGKDQPEVAFYRLIGSRSVYGWLQASFIPKYI